MGCSGLTGGGCAGAVGELRALTGSWAGKGESFWVILEECWYPAEAWTMQSPGKRLPLEPGSQWQHFVTIFTLLLAQCEAFGSPPLAEGISYFITSRQDNLSNFAWKKSLTKSSKATIMPDETVIEFAFLLLSWLSLCWF